MKDIVLCHINLFCTKSTKYRSDRLDVNYDVNPRREVLYVIEIVVKLRPDIFDVGHMPLIYLRPPRYTRTNDVPITIEGKLSFIPARQRQRFRTWPNPTHFATQNIDELRKFIDPRPAKETPEPGYSVITVGGDGMCSII
jgi:hypothetical protein